MQKLVLIVSLFLGLAGCETSPVAKCEASLDRLLADNQEQIDTSQGNINRGYGLAPSRISVGLNACTSPVPNVSICAGGNRDIAPQRIPIDLKAEQAKLEALLAQKSALLSNRTQCVTLYQ